MDGAQHRGKFIHHTETELTEELERPSDDATNTFIARMLLLLESQPLLGTEIYKKVIPKVIDTYPGKAAEKIDKRFDAYGCFLETTGKDEAILMDAFLAEQKRKAFKASANSFGNLVFEILSALGQDNVLFRDLVV